MDQRYERFVLHVVRSHGKLVARLGLPRPIALLVLPQRLGRFRLLGGLDRFCGRQGRRHLRECKADTREHETGVACHPGIEAAPRNAMCCMDSTAHNARVACKFREVVPKEKVSPDNMLS